MQAAPANDGPKAASEHVAAALVHRRNGSEAHRGAIRDRLAVMAWVYILECADGTFYVGSTVDLQRRLWQHQNGEGSRYTARRGRRPVRLVWSAQYHRIDQAFAYEKLISGWRREKKIALIEGRFDDLPELAARSWQALRNRGGSGGMDSAEG